MKIISPTLNDKDIIHQAAQLLVDAFREHWPEAWPTLEEGIKEVHEMFEAERICRTAVDEQGNLIGIIGGIPNTMGMSGSCIRLRFSRICRAKEWAKH